MKKEILIGFVIGLTANVIGLYLAATFLGNGDDFMTVIKAALAEDFIGKLVSLGAILNLLAFFVFIKKRQDYRARGVLLATVIVAILTFVFKYL